jgi:hypothetical protein
MGYKVLGFVVWQGAKFYLRRRYPGAGRKAAVAALAGGLTVGGVAVARAVRSNDD